jgi:pimeloyl-ACP methyl ester carboxylesterase
VRPEPFFFGPPERPLFGWLHRAAPATAPGLVVCNPFGYEAICAHRSLRHIALAAAAAGAPALRFDYDGTGDAAGGDRDPGRVAAWRASIGAAVDALRAATGVPRVVLLGVRLGATLAALAALERQDAAGLVMIAPIVAGSAYLRELGALQMALGLPDPPAGAPPNDGEQEATGFLLTAETRCALMGTDLTSLPRAPAREILLLDRDDMPAPARLSEAWRGLGAAVDHRRLPGYVEMMLDPHRAAVPAAMVRAVVDWLRARPGPPAARPGARLAADAEIGGVGERALFIDDAARFGVLTEPPPGAPARPAVLLINAGAVHRVGPNRLHVSLARRWAARGHGVLRLDLSGIGDSAPAPGGDENDVYAASAHDDIAAALAFLRARPGGNAASVIGLCSGAYHAFKAAVAGLPLARVIAINPLTFLFRPGMAVEYPAYHVARETLRYRQSMRRVESWKKLLRGAVDVEQAAQVVARRAASAVVHRVRDVARRAGRPLPGDLGAELEAVAARGVDLRFVFAGGDPGLALLRSAGGSAIPRLTVRGRLEIHTIEGPDHTFTPLWSHEPLARVLDACIA